MSKLKVGHLERLSVRVFACVASTGLALLLSGCELSPTVTPQDTANVAFGGMVHGGQQPVTGAHIALFATTSAGYGGTLTPLATTTTDSAGQFNIASSYTCPAGQQAYIVATGGNPGTTSGTDNSAIFLVAALGPCTGISSATYVIVNEVTTVAAAYAMGGFAPAGGAGMTEAAVVAGTAMPGFTTSTGNTQGLTDAFANAANIVSYSTGQANATTAGGNGTVPAATINALADILQDCVNSTGPTQQTCVNLFGTNGAQPPTGSGIAAPVNVFQAALDIAQFPANNPAGLFNLISSQSAFNSTGVSVAPNDWTIGIVYTGGQLASALGMVIDNSDNVYITGSTNADLIEFSPQGSVLSPNAPSGQTGWTPSVTAANHNWRYTAIDQSGNLWMSDGSTAGVYEYTPGGTATAPTAGTLTAQSYSAVNTDANNYAIAVDGLGDVWTTSYKKSTCAATTKICELVEFAKGSTPTAYAPAVSFNGNSVISPGVGGARGVVYDVNANNIWITDIVESSIQLFNVTPSATGTASSGAAATSIALGSPAMSDATNNYGAVSVAIDNASRAWAVVVGGPATTGSAATTAVAPALYPISSTGTVGTAATGGGLNSPAYLAIDGNNNLFIANTGPSGSGLPGDVTNAGTVVEYSPGFNSNAGAFLSGSYGFSPGANNAGGTINNGSIYQPANVSVDRSGALWVLSTGSGTPTVVSSVVTNLQTANLIQILGVAAPVNPVLSAGKYGVKP